MLKTREVSQLRWLCGALATTLLASASLAAEGPRYTYGEIGYFDIDIDDIGDGDGWGLNGSVALADMAYVFAGYADGDIDVDGFGFSADYEQITAGLGLNYGISDTIDLFGELGYLSAEVEVSGFSVDEDGYILAAGVRAMVAPQFEVNGDISYSDLGGDYDSDTALGLGAVYNFTDMFAGVAGVSFSDDVTQYGIGVRLYFGNR